VSVECRVCHRDPMRVNSLVSECSFVDCPHRRVAWSERPTRAELFKGPWPKNEDADPMPLYRFGPLTFESDGNLDQPGDEVIR
jgi:hypothetical protein